MTVVFVDCLGRKKTMALQLCIFSIFVFLVSLCTSRYCGAGRNQLKLTVIRAIDYLFAAEVDVYCRSVLIFFLFVARTFISGAFQTAYVYTPEVLTSYIYVLRGY